jgi:initiation factor 1A
MVKNATGGKKAKGMASKHTKPKNKVLRIIQEEGEQYGVVTEKLGGGHAKVACMDNTTRMVVIGSKFKNERLIRNQMVLIGLREWQTKIQGSDKLEKCDLLEIYTDIETDALLHKYGTLSGPLIHLISKLETPGLSSHSSSDVIFSNDTTVDSSMTISSVFPDEVEGSLASIMNTVADEDWFESI